jgi:tRNA threonylcarbamoyladenosine biosynthesis protein TsaE
MESCKKFISSSPSQTKKIGHDLAREILETPSQKGAVVLGLRGDLGGGKTTFLQGFASGLKIKEKVLSPTFIIFRRTRIDKSAVFKNFFHFDCYRLKKAKDVVPLGFKKIITDPCNIVAIEWAERIGGALPARVIFIDFKFIDNKTRKIYVCRNGKK